ncbi:MAG TPA: family 16 glycoside hydrolase, partial [Gemmataceae bacterium]|nr:family 16 glycoside hydrolase [Gemmataceae bacterium]
PGTTDSQTGLTPAPSGSAPPHERLGHYEIREIIGRGGMGMVLKAYDEKLQRIVAIKIMAPELAANATARTRFIREARAAAAVTHDHIVTIHEVQEEHSPPYFVMQYIVGMSLQERLEKKGPLELKQILRIGMQAAYGLAAAHAQGHVHRDIKPANILLENGVERVKITDFGLARAVDDASVTQSGVISGTPMFMSPEQAAGETVDHRSDLFSLGSVLYMLCTGRPPFRATGTMAVMKRVIEDAPRSIREINPEIPDWLEAIIAKLHAKKPEDRFQSAKELAQLLEQHLAHLQQPGKVPLPAPVPVPRTNQEATLRVWRWWLAAFLAPTLLVPMFYAATLIFGGMEDLLFGLVVVAGGGIILTGLSVLIFIVRRMVAKPVATSPATARLRSLIGPAAMGFLLLVVVIVFIPWMSLYLANHSRVEIESQDGLTEVIILQNDVTVHDWMDMRTPQTVTLAPGKYHINPGLKPGYDYWTIGWELTTSGLFSSHTVRQAGSAGSGCDFEVQRGERVTVRAIIRKTNAPPAETDDSQGWVQLFNGKDLTGWKREGDGRGWVVNGVLQEPGLVRTEKAFENYIVHCQFRYHDEKQPGEHLEVLLHMDADPPKKRYILARLWPDGHGDVFGCEGANCRGEKLEGKAKPRNEWSELTVTSRDGTLDFALNGERVGNTTGCEPSWGNIGLIGNVEIRKIEIKELPVEKNQRALAAEVEQKDWVQLFNGKDLTGWKTQPEQPGSWSVENQVLVSRNGPGRLYTFRDDYRNFHLRAEVSISKGAESDIYFRAKMQLLGPKDSPRHPSGYVLDLNEGKDTYTGPISYLNPQNNSWTTQGAYSIVKPDEWFTLDLIADGNHLVSRVNGIHAVDFIEPLDAFPKGHIALETWKPDTVVKFRKIEIKELPPPQAVIADQRSDQEKLQGTWRATAFQVDALRFDLTNPIYKDNLQITLDIIDDRLKMKRIDPPGAPPLPCPEMEGVFHLNPQANPKQITTLSPSPNKSSYGIYRIDGDNLTICQFDKMPKDIRFPTNFTPKDGSNTMLLIFRRDSMKLIEFKAPSVPQRAADILPFSVGSWKTETTILAPKVPAEYARSTGVSTFDLVAGGKFLRGYSTADNGRYENLAVEYYDRDKDTVRGWFFTAVGEVTGPSAGKFDAEKHSLLWMEKLPDGVQRVQEFDFSSGNAIKSRLFHQSSMNEIVLDVRNTFTRLQKPAVLKPQPVDPKRPQELRVLDRLGGDWRANVSVKNAMAGSNPEVSKGQLQIRMILAGHFIEIEEQYETVYRKSHWLAGYDAGKKQYRCWCFRSDDRVFELTGTWDEAKRTMNWTTPDNSVSGHWTFKNNDLCEQQYTFRDNGGKLLYQIEATLRRVPAN